MATAKVWTVKHEFEGVPKVDNFVLVEEKLPDLKTGEILIEALYLSLDPYYRLFSVKDGLPGEQVARVAKSKAPGFPVGSLVCAHAGWRSKTIIDVSKPIRFGIKVELIDEVKGLSPSLWIGAIGMPGVTAYITFYEKCNPKKGEIIVVSAASGAVGSIVGQLAKLQGLTVIGLAGSVEKCQYIKSIGFDHAINYKKDKICASLDTIAPDGIDIYFDSVGGVIRDTAIGKLREKGRVLICGQISSYNEPQTQVTNVYPAIMMKQLEIKGFMIFKEENIKEFPRVRKALIPLFHQDKLKAKEHITEGFENMPKAFIELFTGSNFGKAVVKA